MAVVSLGSIKDRLSLCKDQRRFSTPVYKVSFFLLALIEERKSLRVPPNDSRLKTHIISISDPDTSQFSSYMTGENIVLNLYQIHFNFKVLSETLIKISQIGRSLQ